MKKHDIHASSYKEGRPIFRLKEMRQAALGIVACLVFAAPLVPREAPAPLVRLAAKEALREGSCRIAEFVRAHAPKAAATM